MVVQLALTASFPLGVYYGHKSDGSIENFPSPLRLHSALLNAAAEGTASEDGQPSDKALKALKWLETHPPTGLYQPGTVFQNQSTNRFSYRDIGTFENAIKTDSKHIRKKVAARPISDGVAVRSSFGYVWNDVPEEFAETISRLAEDVPYLGESHSVVVLATEKIEPNWLFAPTANCFTRGAQAQQVPAEGRTDTLIRAHNAQHGGKKPTKSKDKFGKSQKPQSEIPTLENTDEARYMPKKVELAADSPWLSVFLFKLERPFRKRDRVRLCTTMHRSIISLIGYGASPIITGKYDQGVPQPANRLAIQYIPTDLAQLLGHNCPLLAIFVPTGVSDEELAQITRAIEIKRLYSRILGRVNISFENETRSAARFWPAPENNTIRLWTTEMPIVPETRRIKQDGRTWSLGDSAMLSAAYVWRDEFDTSGSGQHRYLSLRDQVAEREVYVFDTSLVSHDTIRYVHHSHKSVPVQPYHATLDLGTLAHPQAAVMLGQSRHLGAGLLRPLDIDISSLPSLGVEQ